MVLRPIKNLAKINLAVLRFSRCNIFRLTFVLLLIFSISACSSFKEVFNGKEQPHRHAKKRSPNSKRAPKQRYRKAPQYAQNYFRWPLKAPVSSIYGKRWGRFHDGIDIDGDMGDRIRAAAPGKVVYSGVLGSYGKIIVIQHKNGFFTAYAHNKKNLVKKGRKVKQGQVIGLVGSTGRSTGSHLHFEVRDKKGTYNPLDLLPRRRYTRR